MPVQPKVTKRMRDKNGIDLRITARGRDEVAAQLATRELRRRVDNLTGGVIAPWELEARGPDPRLWEVV